MSDFMRLICGNVCQEIRTVTVLSNTSIDDLEVLMQCQEMNKWEPLLY